MTDSAPPELLDRLLAFDPPARARLAALPPLERVGRRDTVDGPIVTVDGRGLHSSRRPDREARRWARELDLQEATVVVLLGFGSGYAVRALRRRTQAPIIVFEPNAHVLDEGLTHGPVPSGVLVITDAERLGIYLGAFLTGTDRGSIVQWTPSIRTDRRAYGEALNRSREAIDRARLRYQTAMLRGDGWLRHYLKNLPAVCDAPPLSEIRDALRGVPAIVVAAGPSLDRNVDLLRELDDTALILTVNTSARALDRAGIRPHALVTIESADTTDGMRDVSWLLELPAFIELTASPAMWELPFPHKVAISVDTNACSTFSRSLAPGLAISAGFCVANASVAVAHALGCDPIVLIGSDLSYSGERVYATGTMFEGMRAVDQGDGSVRLEGTEARREIETKSAGALGQNRAPSTAQTLRVPSYDGSGTVTTSNDFKLFRDWYTYAADRMSVQLINATEGGARIPGWEHVPLRTVIERHALTTRGDREPVTRQLASLFQRSGLPSSRIRDLVEAEREQVSRLQTFANRALELVGHNPDGDLDIDDDLASQLHEINRETREHLHRAPLAGEACYRAIEALRMRGEVTTYAFYASLLPPLADLDEQLARLLQHLSVHPNPARQAG